jgi:hypothetical protein
MEHADTDEEGVLIDLEELLKVNGVARGNKL